MDFLKWDKIPRFNKTWEITEKVDGTNGVLYWSDHHDMRWDGSLALATVDGLHLYAGSRTRWLTPGNDNYGFARWAQENAHELAGLGEGRHYGEWFGNGIQRNYGMTERSFALFNTKWAAQFDMGLPKGVCTVPVMMESSGRFLNQDIEYCVEALRREGSMVAPGFMKPEGIVVRHVQHGDRYKVLLENDEIPKELVTHAAPEDS